MKENKYRFWDSFNGQFYYATLDELINKKLLGFRAVIQDGQCEKAEQYIGLKNKQNREAYEHDIYKAKNKIYVIKWSNYACGFYLYTIDGILASCVNETNLHLLKYVGNIHENHELLNGIEWED